MNETFNTVPGDNLMVILIQGIEKKIYNELSNCDESLYIPIVLTLTEESAISMIAVKNAVDYIPKKLPPCGRNHVRAACTYSCTDWFLSYLWWRSWEKQKQGKKR